MWRWRFWERKASSHLLGVWGPAISQLRHIVDLGTVLAPHARYAIGQSTIGLGRARGDFFSFLFFLVKNRKIGQQVGGKKATLGNWIDRDLNNIQWLKTPKTHNNIQCGATQRPLIAEALTGSGTVRTFAGEKKDSSGPKNNWRGEMS